VRVYHPSSEVATALEALMSITTKEVEVSDKPLEGIYFARTCYDHIAGHVGVALADSMQKQGWIKPDNENFALTAKGEKQFSNFGIEIEPLRKKRRHFARQCLDWTERRHHLSGSLGLEKHFDVRL